MELKKQLTKIACAAQQASRYLATISTKKKNAVIRQMAKGLLRCQAEILQANKKDVSLAKRQGLPEAFFDRLILSEKRIQEMSDCLLALINLRDPVGEVIRQWRRPNGLRICKVRVPIGVIAIIYESRPNVTSDCIGLCFKSGNSVILKGGSESLFSNLAIFKVLYDVFRENGIPTSAINLIATKSREVVKELLGLSNYIDLVIPRGGEGLINQVTRYSHIPVIKHYKGICHVYVDEWADLNMAQSICFNAKVQRPGVCNAMETMLVHKDIAARFLPSMFKKFKESGVQIRACAKTLQIVRKISPWLMDEGEIKKAQEQDFYTEYLGLILSVRVVDSLKEAIEHVNHYGSHHSDSIITDNRRVSAEFLKKVDSACVYVNASTRFTDGYQFGLGAEIGISTDKLHARGPMALEELTTYKYMVLGNGQIRN